jgi:heme/copper-type cytochrome/quinol oxidase subunit 4
MKALLTLFAVVQLVLGLLLWLAPGFFFDEIGPYGTRNDHYMGDVATWYLALGAVALVAVQHASWRVPVLALAFVQYALHSLNHLIDIGEAEPSWLGPFNFASLLLTTILLAWMLRREEAPA